MVRFSHEAARIKTLIRLLPPPRHLAPLLRALPSDWQHALLERVLVHVLAKPSASSDTELLARHRLGIEVSDLQLHWVVTRRDGVLAWTDAAAEVSLRGTATDLLLFISRLEDADTLFRQQRLTLHGDAELVAMARRQLEHLPWEAIPLGLRIVLNRGARLARAAQQARRTDA